MSDLEEAIYRTIRWFDILGQPVTATQIWMNLVAPVSESNWRWAGHGIYSLSHIQKCLAGSDTLIRKTRKKWGYYFLAGRECLVEEKLAGHARAQALIKKARAVTWILAIVPGVRMLALSGSAAMGYAKETSDIDILTVVNGGRMWLTRLLLLIAAQLTGRRRKYWDKEAPDKLCLNHILSDRDPATHNDIRNLYTATLYYHVVPLYGCECFGAWRRANSTWMKRQLMISGESLGNEGVCFELPGWAVKLKEFFENILQMPFSDWVERLAEKWQRVLIARHAEPGQSGRVSFSSTELAFHPDSKVPGLLEEFSRDEGQKKLLY